MGLAQGGHGKWAEIRKVGNRGPSPCYQGRSLVGRRAHLHFLLEFLGNLQFQGTPSGQVSPVVLWSQGGLVSH